MTSNGDTPVPKPAADGEVSARGGLLPAYPYLLLGDAIAIVPEPGLVKTILIFAAVAGTNAAMPTAIHAGVVGEPCTPDAIAGILGTFAPFNTYSNVAPVDLIASGYLFADWSVRIHPTRRRCVYPLGIVGVVAESDSNDATVVPFETTHTLYHVLAANEPASRPLSPEALATAVTATFLASNAPGPLTASSTN